MNFQSYIGNELWNELSAFRREDTYKNDNYISDGLDNSQLLKKAIEFINIAQKDIFKSATLQHSITTNLKNLLIIPEFTSVLNQFQVGNWIRAKIDTKLYKLRLLDYEIDFDNLEKITVTFSDVIFSKDGISDVASIINQAHSISTSYDTVKRQAKDGATTNTIVNSWVDNGLN